MFVCSITLITHLHPPPRSMMIIKSSCSSLFLLLICLQPSHANHINCSPSSCGLIPSISPPFRLKNQHKHCGDPRYELACENNVALLYLNSQKYQVQDIDYQNHTIRLADASININGTCSFPQYSLYHYNFRGNYPYSTQGDYFSGEVAWPINFMSCPYQLKDSSLFTEATHCVDGENVIRALNSSNSRYTYVKVGHMNASYVKYMCRVDLMAMTSWKFKDVDNASLSEIHDSLLYGFELSWWRFPCGKCKKVSHCLLSKNHKAHKANCLDTPAITILFLVFIAVLLTGAFPVLIIIGFACLFGIFFFDSGQLEWSLSLLELYPSILVLTVYIHTAMIFIGFPLVMALLVRKFRRRHMSMFDAIESFLRSDNKLMPIRYSYSNIKRMTGGFREKLGQGGYGSVYKGKLRSGDYVAVKLLEKSNANGQDFMNEIATIGRIHHVNIVKLVGYCAERSKRALLYDFMSNGSLEKYISRENMNSLNWKTKFEIAVGVARGIEYLHHGCDIQILHFDIKPHNILLDDKFIPKVSDFGLAKICSAEKNTVTLTAARGTIGYVAPELINRGIGRVSYKADVYSFGMLLIEMVGLKRDLIGNNENSSQYFPYWIYHCFEQDKDIEFGKTNENDDSGKFARKMTIVALWCIQMSPDDRPSMNKVLEMLEGEVERLRTPDRPSQSAQVAEKEDQRWSTYSSDSVSLLCHDAAPSVDIIVEDLTNLQ